jgi:2-iminobutanoate/2-iminopropanoate deaminase
VKLFRVLQLAAIAAGVLPMSGCLIRVTEPPRPGPRVEEGIVSGGMSGDKHVVLPAGTTTAGTLLAPGIMVGNTLYVSGNTGNDPATRALAPGGVGPETTQAIANSRAVLLAAGMDLSDVVAVTAYLTDAADFQAFNAAYRALFTTDPRPTRTTVVVKQLVGAGAHVEITMTAVKSK